MRKTRINRVQGQCQDEGSHGEPCRELRNKAVCLINSLSTTEQAQGGFGEIGQPSFHEGGLDHVTMKSCLLPTLINITL